MKIFFLLNPSEPRRLRTLRYAASTAARKQGWTPRFGEIDRTRPGSADTALRQSMAEGCSRIVSVGGDGSLNRLFRFLQVEKMLAKVEVGLIPAGTCNDFGRGLRLSPKRFREAFDTACAGQVRDMDLADMNGGLFFNNAGFGRKMSPSARRPPGPIRSLRAFEPVTLKASWDKGSVEGVFFMGLVCNSPFFSGGLHFSKLPRVDDGLLDLFLVPKIGKMKLAALVLLGKLGRPLKTRHLLSIRAPEIRMEADRDLWPQTDGEPPLAPARSLHFKILREKARFIFPVP